MPRHAHDQRFWPNDCERTVAEITRSTPPDLLRRGSFTLGSSLMPVQRHIGYAVGVILASVLYFICGREWDGSFAAVLQGRPISGAVRPATKALLVKDLGRVPRTFEERNAKGNACTKESCNCEAETVHRGSPGPRSNRRWMVDEASGRTGGAFPPIGLTD